MARAFAGGDDRLDPSTNTYSAGGTSWSIWVKRDAAGANRIWHRGGLAATHNNANSQYRLIAVWTGATAEWSVPRPSINDWHHLLWVYDDGSTANDPLCWIDGTSQTVTREVAPSGSTNFGTGDYDIGHNNGVTEWEGELAEFAVFAGEELNQGHASALAAGMPASRVHRTVNLYVPIWGFSPEPDLSGNGNNATVTNAPLVDHPPMRPYAEMGWQNQGASGATPLQTISMFHLP